MRLRTQLLLFGLLTLALPWAGLQYVREMESALRQAEANNVANTARLVAGMLAYEPARLYPYAAWRSPEQRQAEDFYAHTLTRPMQMDGFHDDWLALQSEARRIIIAESVHGPQRWAELLMGTDHRHLYLFMKVPDKRVIYANPTQGQYGDHLVLVLEDRSGQLRRYRLATAAPGRLVAELWPEDDFFGLQQSGPREPRIAGNWREQGGGWQLEMRLPLSMVGGRMGIGLAAVDRRADVFDDETTQWAGSWRPGQNTLKGRLFYSPQPVQAALQGLVSDTVRLRVVASQGWSLGYVGAHGGGQPYAPLRSRAGLGEIGGALLHRFYRTLFDIAPLGQMRRREAGRPQQAWPDDTELLAALGGKATRNWYRPQYGDGALIAAAAPIRVGSEVIGAVQIEQTSDAILTLTNQALVRLIGLTFLAAAVVLLGLMGYATWLSLRIRKLRNATEAAIGPDGNLADEFIESRRGDELGDLSRSFGGLLKRLRDYNDYLQTLADKLSHELRTPLAIVRSSLDNLTQESLVDSSKVYVQRAANGAARLAGILDAMREATHVEQTIDQAELEQVDLAAILAGMTDAYRDVYPEREFGLDIAAGDWHCQLAPELIAQLLDKLVDNAVGFSPANGWISLQLRRERQKILLCVANQGPALPARMQGNLFDSLVSVRSAKASDAAHLGLGLYIARLIAEWHGGSISAQDTDAGDGVVFTVELPQNRT